MCEALRRFINQRSGIDGRNYGLSREAFMGDYRPILRHGKHARQMLRFVELRDSITAEMLKEATGAFSGRLQFIERGDKVSITRPANTFLLNTAMPPVLCWQGQFGSGCAPIAKTATPFAKLRVVNSVPRLLKLGLTEITP